MKQLLYTISAICLVSCSPRLHPGIKDEHPPLPDSAFVLILSQEDRFNNSDKIGLISISDNEFSSNCNYEALITRLKQKARSQGANLIKITDYKKTDDNGNCDKITAKLYKVDNVKLYEKKFEWSPNRKLTWEDFKGNPALNPDTNVAARTSCRFGIRIDTTHASAKVSVVVTNEFICYQSSVRPRQQKTTLLAHEQLHFDLCEVYARKLRKELTDIQLTLLNANTVSENTFLKIYKIYKERQWLYDEETNHGLDLKAQELWNHTIAEELKELAAYAR